VRVLGIWIIVLVAAATLLAATGYRTRDADSRAYIAIAARLADEPPARWIAPQWWGAWGGQGLFREHPAGTFVPPALLARAGYPSEQSLFVVTLAAQMVAMLTLTALAASLVPGVHARLLLWALPLIPIAFVFRVRANQEYLLLAGMLIAVYGTERARKRPGWSVVAAVGALFALLVKGVFGLFAPVTAAIWLWTRRTRGGIGPGGWMTLAVLAVLPFASAWLYERAYVAATGQSFIDYYLGARIGLESGGTLPFPLDKVANAFWYAGRVIWYAAPWSVAALLAIAPARTRLLPEGVRAWTGFALLASAATLALVAARDTKADRYIFPAYFFVASAGVIYACARWPRVSAVAERLDRYGPWGPALFWLALVAGRILLR
jgi:hypothetical protein